jgi:diguanylate cyclase (GGDEF)-like protein
VGPAPVDGQTVNLRPVLLTALFLLAAIIAIAVAVTGWRQRRLDPVVRPLTVIAAGIATWSIMDAAGVFNPRPDGLTILALLLPGIFAVFAVTTGFYCLSLAVLDRSWRLSRRTALRLAIEPTIVLLLIATNHWQRLFVDDHLTTAADGTATLRFGPAFWLHTLYSYGLLLAGVIRLGRAFIRAHGTHRRIYGWLLLAGLPPVVVNVVTLAFAGRVVDFTAVGFTATVVMMYWVLVFRPIVNLVPVARQQVVHMIDDAVVVVDDNAQILDVNPAAEHLLGATVGAQLAECLGTPVTLATSELTVTDVRGTGTDLNVRISPLRDRRDGSVGWAVVARDVTHINGQRRELELANALLLERLQTIELLRADLADQALRDSLTGLHNRRYLMESLPNDLASAAREHQPVALAILDVDFFKQINDRFGHLVGDEVLIRIAGLLASELRGDDTLVRYGGEEFVVVLPGATAAVAMARIEGLRLRMERDGHDIAVTFSAGVAVATGPETPSGLLRLADAALYAAKHGGRNRVELAAASSVD